MAVYVIADIEVSDPEAYRAYMALSPAAIKAAGGEFVVRGGEPEVLEGHWQPSRIVVLKFADRVQAKAFYDSPLYLEARKTRAGATAKFNMILVEGTP